MSRALSRMLTDRSVIVYTPALATRSAAKKKLSQRSTQAIIRREAIIGAALEEFIEKGFAAARMEDIARRAGVAKGTIYLHFSDKEALFEGIINQEIRPNVDALASAAAVGGSLHELIEQILLPALGELIHTRRGAVLRLLIGEAGRFPKLAEVYYRVVVEPGLQAMRGLVQRAKKQGQLTNDLLVEFPQLLIAPMLLAVIWTGLFQRFRHVDLEYMASAYFEHMLGSARTSQPVASKRVKRVGGRHG